MGITRKVSTKAKAKAKANGSVLMVDSMDKIAGMEALLGKGSITFVLIYADWCGACTKFKKNIWNPMCQKSATHSRIAVRDDMIKNTSLASANFDYLPSLVVVDENGKIQSFKTPEGKNTNAMPTPQSLQEMNTIVNVPVMNISPTPVATPSYTEYPELNISPTPVATPSYTEYPEMPISQPLTQIQNIEPISEQVVPTLGKSYIPTPMVAPMKGGKRGSARRFTMSLPKKVLKGLTGLFKRSRKHKSRKVKRTTM